jgi:hypothetical protein
VSDKTLAPAVRAALVKELRQAEVDLVDTEKARDHAIGLINDYDDKLGKLRADIVEFRTALPEEDQRPAQTQDKPPGHEEARPRRCSHTA